MPIQILMPALSPTMTEGNLVKWHKVEGDVIKAGEVLAEIETDKATMEVEAVDEGILGKILIAAGAENVKVNQLIALILEEGEDASALQNADSNTPQDSTALVVEKCTIKGHHSNDEQNAVTEPKQQSNSLSSERIFITPLAKRIAEQKNIDTKSIQGSGPAGRIVKADVEKAPENKSISPSFASSTVQTGGYKDVSLNGMRKVIAKRLTESKQNVPHFYLSVDCQLDALMSLRAQLNNHPKAPTKLSVNDFIVRACALALIEVPESNATWHDSFVRLYDNADVSVAVAIDGGLVTPVVRAAETKSLMIISQEVKSLAERARAGKLMPEEYQGGSFTLSNLGMFGVKNFSAILNPPQACILAVGAGEQRAIVKDGQLSIATVMSCTLSVDHRAVDGAVGAKFLDAFKKLIENPIGLLM